MFNSDIFSERSESQDRLIKQLVKMGYEYVSRSESDSKRGSLAKVIYTDELAKFLASQTYKYRGVQYHFSGESINKAIQSLDVSLLKGLMMASKDIYNYLCNGISVEESIAVAGESLGIQSFDLNYIDWDNPQNNIWQVTEEFSVEGAMGRYSRPDIVLLCNGIPLVVIECKSASISVDDAVNQNIRNMMPDHIPQLFKYVQLVMAVNPNKVKYGTTGTTAKYFVEWHEDDTEWQNSELTKCMDSTDYTEQDRVAVSMLSIDKSQNRLLDIIRFFILYDSNIKKIARYQQYFAVNNAIKRIKGEDGTDSKGGVIWHTQGSGKSLTMVMLVKKIQAEKSIVNPRFLIVTDRVNLDKQIKENFVNTAMSPVRATTGKGLRKLLENKKYVIITTLINKFEFALKVKGETIDSDNMFVLIDEAHRSQYKAMNNYMTELLPHAVYIAFTGTPLVSSKSKGKIKVKSVSKSATISKFGPFIKPTYTMKQSIIDKVTVPIVYEGRKVIHEDAKQNIDYYFDSLTKNLDEKVRNDLKTKFSRYKAIAETKPRLDLIAWDIAEHFKTYCLPKELKAMVVCSSRANAVTMYETLSKLDDDIHPAVVISYNAKDEDESLAENSTDMQIINRYFKQCVEPLFGSNVEAYDDAVCNKFKSNDFSEVNMLIVKDKLLTGFDAPVAGVLYVDKSMQQHSVLQAIARVNRVYEGKEVGLVVDYYGIFTKLNEAIDLYDDLESGFDAFDKEDIEGSIFGPIDEKNKLDKAYCDLNDMFESVDKTSSNAMQVYLEDDIRRKEFYDLLKRFGSLLDLAVSNRAIFKAIGYEKLDEYKHGFVFYTKLRNEVALRYNDKGDFSKYESSIKELLNTFVKVEGIGEVVKPFDITNKKERDLNLDKLGSKEAKADAIKTRVVSELKQKRYDDPIFFEKFHERINKTIAEYNQTRDADAYLLEIESIADDIGSGRTERDYPSIIRTDSDAKAFYGTMVNVLTDKINSDIVLINEEYLAEKAKDIKEIIKSCTKRDWKENVTVHKEIHSQIDDVMFELFDKLDIDCNNESNIQIIDLIEEKLMELALRRY